MTSTLSAQMSVKAGSQATLLTHVLRLTQRELDSDQCTPTLRQTFTLLTNLAMCADCRNVLWKVGHFQHEIYFK